MNLTGITKKTLSQRRSTIDAQWGDFTEGHRIVAPAAVSADIMSSWRRSAKHIKPVQSHAPADDEYTATQRWRESHLYQASLQAQDSLSQLASEGQLVAAISDSSGRLLHTFAGQHMRRRAESVNFVAGGHWDERSVGTNAIALSLRLRRSVTVFSSEHYLPFVHDWVCYAAPIIHPQSGQCVGTLDLSSTWNCHNPLGEAAVTELARSIAAGLPQNLPRAELEIHAMGQPRVLFRGKELHLQMRQVEILCLLALNPQGLSLEGFHAALYGDAAVSTSTLKSELSHLRGALDGQIGSRPYRLQVPVWADFIQIWQTIRQQRTDEAFELYRGSLLAQSNSPELSEWRNCIDAGMSQVLNNCDDAAVLLDKLCDTTGGSELVRERLAELIQTHSN